MENVLKNSRFANLHPRAINFKEQAAGDESKETSEIKSRRERMGEM
jgi:hypothetical protein